MIPEVNDGLIADFDETIEQPSKTYKLNTVKNRIVGYIDEIEALKQAIFLILNIERYDYIIYSWNYGVELSDLFGKPIAFVLPEIKRRVTEALIQDDRIDSVDTFKFVVNKGKVLATFTVHSIYGEIEAEKEVMVNAAA
jgi:hypothetical protein